MSIHLFSSQFVPARAIRVYVPANYDSTAHYDVLYMHDGTMLFDASITWNKQEWGVDEAMDSLQGGMRSISCTASSPVTHTMKIHGVHGWIYRLNFC